MEKHVIVIEYLGEEPNFEALKAAIKGIGDHVPMAEQDVTPIPLSEEEKAEALYLFALIKGSNTKSPLSVELKKPKRSKKSILEDIAKILNDV